MRRYISTFVHSLRAVHTGGHHVHSPYLFRFVKFLLADRAAYYCFDRVEALRGGRRVSRREVRVDQLVFRVVHDLRPRRVLMLGASSAERVMYAALAAEEAQCVVLGATEGVRLRLAECGAKMALGELRVGEGNIREELSLELAECRGLDVVVVDARVLGEELCDVVADCLPLMGQESMMLMVGLGRGRVFREVWKRVCAHERVTATIDMYDLGVVLFNSDYQKIKYKVRF